MNYHTASTIIEANNIPFIFYSTMTGFIAGQIKSQSSPYIYIDNVKEDEIEIINYKDTKLPNSKIKREIFWLYNPIW